MTRARRALYARLIGNTGALVLRGFVVTFDSKSRRLKLERPAA